MNTFGTAMQFREIPTHTNEMDPKPNKQTNRLVKEAAYYQQEVKENEAKLQNMKDQQKDPYDIKKFEEVLGESYMMIPDSQKRLQKSLEDLSLFLDTQSDDSSNPLDGSEWLSTARELLEDNLKKEDKDVETTNVEGLEDGEAF